MGEVFSSQAESLTSAATQQENWVEFIRRNSYDSSRDMFPLVSKLVSKIFIEGLNSTTTNLNCFLDS